jgi:hypothetical protein
MDRLTMTETQPIECYACGRVYPLYRLADHIACNHTENSRAMNDAQLAAEIGINSVVDFLDKRKEERILARPLICDSCEKTIRRVAGATSEGRVYILSVRSEPEISGPSSVNTKDLCEDCYLAIMRFVDQKQNTEKKIDANQDQVPDRKSDGRNPRDLTLSTA